MTTHTQQAIERLTHEVYNHARLEGECSDAGLFVTISHDDALSILTSHAALTARVAELEEWVEVTGDVRDVCTFNILGKVCNGCRCERSALSRDERSEG